MHKRTVKVKVKKVAVPNFVWRIRNFTLQLLDHKYVSYFSFTETRIDITRSEARGPENSAKSVPDITARITSPIGQVITGLSRMHSIITSIAAATDVLGGRLRCLQEIVHLHVMFSEPTLSCPLYDKRWTVK